MKKLLILLTSALIAVEISINIHLCDEHTFHVEGSTAYSLEQTANN